MSTEQRRELDELRALKAKLEENERLYQAILRTTFDGYWTVDLEGRFVDVNQAYCDLIGYSREELLARRISDVEANETPEDTGRHIRMVLERGSDRFETRHRRKDGQLIDVEVNTVFLPRAGGQLVVFLRDLTERKRVEAERAELLRREQEARLLAEQANRAKDAFLATLSHELRTPLTPILAWAQLMQMGEMSADNVRRAGETIERSARAQSQLIDDLLDVSKIVKGKVTIEKEHVSPVSPLMAAVESLRPQAQSKSIHIELDVATRPVTVFADPMRLQQVFSNLLANAIKFTPVDGGVRVSLELQDHDAGGRPGSFVLVQVKDTGRGIHPKFVDRIFEPFVQEDESTSRAGGGLGLGLAIVKSLVEIHQGRVEVESEGEGKGATFSVWLPVSEAHETLAQPSDRAPLAASSPDRQLEGLRVLVVDDEPSSCEAIAEILRSAGAEVTTSHSAGAALAQLGDSRPDVVVSDIAMPGWDGYALLQEIRANDRADGRALLPVIALTAYASPQDAHGALAAGFQLHVAKPVDARRLIAAVQQVMESRATVT